MRVEGLGLLASCLFVGLYLLLYLLVQDPRTCVTNLCHSCQRPQAVQSLSKNYHDFCELVSGARGRYKGRYKAAKIISHGQHLTAASSCPLGAAWRCCAWRCCFDPLPAIFDPVAAIPALSCHVAWCCLFAYWKLYIVCIVVCVVL